MIAKLIVEEFETEEGQEVTYRKGYQYSYFKDPETGKYYVLNADFEVTGDNLEKLFHEVEVEGETESFPCPNYIKSQL